MLEYTSFDFLIIIYDLYYYELLLYKFMHHVIFYMIYCFIFVSNPFDILIMNLINHIRNLYILVLLILIYQYFINIIVDFVMTVYSILYYFSFFIRIYGFIILLFLLFVWNFCLKLE